MTTASTIARALKGDDRALAEIEPAHHRPAILRTRERLQNVGAKVAAEAAGKTQAEVERLLTVEIHKALIELDPALGLSN